MPKNSATEDQARTLDFRRLGWGHNCSFIHKHDDKGLRWDVALHSTPYPRVGDYLLVSSGAQETRYQITEVRACGDPADMFFATIEFAPRAAPASSVVAESPSHE